MRSFKNTVINGSPRVRNGLFALGLVVYAILAAGSGPSMNVGSIITSPSGVTLSQIVQGAQVVYGLLDLLRKLSSDATQSVGQGYQDLGSLLKEQNMTDAKILAMEKRLGDMRGRTARFSQTLARTRASADQLFDLLSRRARDNGNEKWREQLLNDIARKKSEFNLKMDLAGNGLLRLESSIKKYDDILGFLQVNRGLEGVNRYMAEIDQTVAQSIALNNEIQNAIQEGLKLVDPKQFQR